MKLNLIVKLLSDAYKKDIENRLWQQFLVDYSRMDKETFISFEEYKKMAIKPKINNKIDVKINNKIDVEKILEDAEIIKDLDQKGDEKN